MCIVRERQVQMALLCLLCLRALGELNSRPGRCESCTQSSRRLTQRRLSAADYLCCVAVSGVVRCVGSRTRLQHVSAFKHSQHSSRCCLMTSSILPQMPLLQLQRSCWGILSCNIVVIAVDPDYTNLTSLLKKHFPLLFVSTGRVCQQVTTNSNSRTVSQS